MPHNSTHTYIVLLHRFHRPENTPCRSFEPTSVTSIYDPCTSCDQYHILSYPTKQPASTTQRTRLQYHSWSCWVFFFSPTDTINRLWDSNSSWMRTAHISHHKLCDMLLPGMYVRVCVQIRQYWSEHLCAPTSSTSYVLIFINVFRFWRFFLSSSLCLSLSCFFHFPRFLFAIATLYSVLVYTMPSETNNECAALLFFFSLFFIFIRLLLDLRSRNRTIVISSVARYISHCYCNTTVVIVKSTKIHSWARDRPTDTWSSNSNRHSHSSTPR